MNFPGLAYKGNWHKTKDPYRHTLMKGMYTPSNKTKMEFFPHHLPIGHHTTLTNPPFPHPHPVKINKWSSINNLQKKIKGELGVRFCSSHTMKSYCLGESIISWEKNKGWFSGRSWNPARIGISSAINLIVEVVSTLNST